MNGASVVATVSVIQLAAVGIGGMAIRLLSNFKAETKVFRKETSDKLDAIAVEVKRINGRVQESERYLSKDEGWKEAHEALTERCMHRFDRIDEDMREVRQGVVKG